jgi:hypothetical protein
MRELVDRAKGALGIFGKMDTQESERGWIAIRIDRFRARLF